MSNKSQNSDLIEAPEVVEIHSDESRQAPSYFGTAISYVIGPITTVLSAAARPFKWSFWDAGKEDSTGTGRSSGSLVEPDGSGLPPTVVQDENKAAKSSIMPASEVSERAVADTTGTLI